MKNYKYLTISILVSMLLLCMILGLAACDDEGNPDGSGGASEAAAQTAAQTAEPSAAQRLTQKEKPAQDDIRMFAPGGMLYNEEEDIEEGDTENTPGDTTTRSGRPSSSSSSSAPDLQKYTEEILRLVNAERAKVGLGALLGTDAALNKGAMERAVEIITLYDHTRPNGQSWRTILPDKYYYSCGENIAYGYQTPEAVMKVWMKSAGHKENILYPDFTHLGVGIASARNGDLYWVQILWIGDVEQGSGSSTGSTGSSTGASGNNRNSSRYDWESTGWKYPDWWYKAGDCTFRQVEQWLYDMSEDEWYGLWRFLTANVSDKEYNYLYNLGWEDYVQYITDTLNGKL